MQPDLEVIQIGRDKSFRAWEHGYPYRTVRWHFHPEFELHHVVATCGRYFVGDFIGNFEPGNLVLAGPNLPHNWISDVGPDEVIPVRNQVLQFTEEFIGRLISDMPELRHISSTLARSRGGLLFSQSTTEEIAPLLADLVEANGARSVGLFFSIMDVLSRDSDAKTLTSSDYVPDPSAFMSVGLNEALAHINDNLTEPLQAVDLAEIAGLSRSAFCRSFRRHTGLSPVQYVNRLRINLACQLLMSEEDMKVTEICFLSGFNNLANFNRQFAAIKGMSPSVFRARMLEGLAEADKANQRVA